MPNLRIITPNDADTATLSGDARLGNPLSNLQDQTRKRTWRSTGLIDQTIRGEWPDVRALSGFALVRSSLSPAATIRLRIWDAPAQSGALLYDSGVVELGSQVKGWGEFLYGTDPWGGVNIFSGWALTFSVIWFALVSGARSFSVLINDSGSPEAYVEASRLFLGNYFEPKKNIGIGLKLSWQESTRQFRTDGATLRSDGFEPYRRWMFQLRYMNEVDRAKFLDLVRFNGMRRDMFMSCFPETGGATERDYSGQVKLARMPGTVHDRLNNWTTDDVVLVES
jgi:hypothetical protein